MLTPTYITPVTEWLPQGQKNGRFYPNTAIYLLVQKKITIFEAVFGR